MLCLIASSAHGEIKTVQEAETLQPECDTCLARQNGKRALRAYLAEKRAQEEAEAKDKDDE